MAVKIRLARYGSKKKPFYRVVAAESKYPRDGRFLQILGTYDPRNKENGLNLNIEDLQGWISKGAEISTTVKKLMRHSQQGASSNT